MRAGESSIVHHVALVLFLLCVLNRLGFYQPFTFFISFLYLYKVHERISKRLWRRLHHEERKHANQRRVLLGSESVNWLNHAVEKIWPLCMERIVSQRLLLPITPWFLDKFKPWTAKKAIVQHLYLGRSPPMFTEVRVYETTDDDHLLLELGLNFLAADDMSAVIAVKLRKRLGFGIWAKMHVKGMHIEGKVLVGLKFIQRWPFIGRVRVCFIEPPYVQVTVKPIFHHGLDVGDLPGIASWMDKIIDAAFERTLVEPNRLVIDVEKFASSGEESWFTVDVKSPVAFAKVEIIEAIGMQPSDSNGPVDPYVKGQLGTYTFQTKIQRKTLSPKWLEEFKAPIASWEACNKLSIEVRDKDHIFVGKFSINIIDLRDGQRHDKWVALENMKAGRLHLAITIIEIELGRFSDNQSDGDKEATNTGSTSVVQEDSSVISFFEVGKKLSADDNFGTKNIKDEAFISLEKQYESLHHVHCASPRSSTSSSYNDDALNDETRGDGHTRGKIRRGLHKLGIVVHPKSLDTESREQEHFKIEKNDHDETHRSTRIKERSIDIMKHAGKSAHNFKIRLKEKVRKKLRQEDAESESCKSDDL